jgi:hypothetical protein
MARLNIDWNSEDSERQYVLEDMDVGEMFYYASAGHEPTIFMRISMKAREKTKDPTKELPVLDLHTGDTFWCKIDEAVVPVKGSLKVTRDLDYGE